MSIFQMVPDWKGGDGVRGNYVLDENGKPVFEPDILKWGRWFHSCDRHVGKTEIGGVLISTVFLGIDHNWGPGPPVLWETMVFGETAGELDQAQQRWTSLEQAKSGHQVWVQRVRDKLGEQEMIA